MRWTTVPVGAAWVAALLVCALTASGTLATTSNAWQVLAIGAVAAVPLVLGSWIALRRPGHPAGPLLAVAGTVALFEVIPTAAGSGALEGSWMVLYLPLALLLLVMPDGHAASPRWRRVGPALTLVVASFMGVVALQWAEPGWSGATTPLTGVLLGAFLALLVACAAAPVVRYRHEDEVTRLRLRWLLLAGSSLPLTLLLCWAGYLLRGDLSLVAVGLVIMYLSVPVGTTLALLAPTLVDVDRLAVGVATVLCLVSGVVTVLALVSLAAGTSPDRWPPVAVGVLTLVLTLGAVLVGSPLHRALDRVLYPERARAVAAVRDLSARVDSGRAQPEELQQVLRGALRDPGLLVALRSMTGPELRDGTGAPVHPGPRSLRVVVRGEDAGSIVPAAPRAKAPSSDIARAAAPLVDAARMRGELARAVTEVEASRERILRAGYQERRRLERDLHDGAQQRLVALGMRLRVLQRSTGVESALARELDRAVAELSTSVAELRHLAHGVRPSSLDDGLGAALASLGALVPDLVEIDVVAPEVPDATALTAYYVVSEDVSNALRRSEASHIRVVVRHVEDRLHVTVRDDGRGGARIGREGGLTGLADRVRGIGGHLRLDSSPAGGTAVEAVLPCAS